MILEARQRPRYKKSTHIPEIQNAFFPKTLITHTQIISMLIELSKVFKKTQIKFKTTNFQIFEFHKTQQRCHPLPPLSTLMTVTSTLSPLAMPPRLCLACGPTTVRFALGLLFPVKKQSKKEENVKIEVESSHRSTQAVPGN